MLNLSSFDYYLPKSLIAQKPVKPRDHSRLLVLDKKNSRIRHDYFYNILDYLKKGDLLVLNDSKVFPARLIGKKSFTGGRIEVFLHQKSSLNLPPARGEKKRGGEVWNCLLGGHGRKEGLCVEFGQGLRGEVIKNNNDGTWKVKFNKSGKVFMEKVEKIGLTPLPPYIKRPAGKKSKQDMKDYQTIYANEKKVGSVAAPTAGLHFTPSLFKKIKNIGVETVYVTLHVGMGTFAPVKVNDIRKHKMHAENIEIKGTVIKKIIKAKAEGRRVIAVGTTAARTIEGAFCKIKVKNLEPKNFRSWVDIFIYPGYKFKVVDAMITNFHLPKSTLLMLVSAFAGNKKINKAYGEAIKKKYRFYSYGDAMFIC